MNDEFYMSRALELAERGVGAVNPNPLVGCVLVRDGKVIGEGWHTAFGKLHAEREALADCRARGEDPRGATAYVTLEPCCHYGKTPPCTEGLIEAGVVRVVVGAPDPNPQVAGRGCAALRAAGIEVTEGVLLDACQAVNRVFFHYITHKRPYVIAKYAMTLDGKITTRTGASKWITGAAARQRVHEDRNRYAAIMVGVGTVLADDPLLTCRLDEQAGAAQALAGEVAGADAHESAGTDGLADMCELASADARESAGTQLSAGKDAAAHPRVLRNPVRIICDTHLRTPLEAQVVVTAHEAPTIIATCEDDPAFHAPYLERGCEVLVAPKDAAGRVDLDALMDALGARGIDGVIVEGGASLLGAAFDAHVVNKVQAYVAPKVFGGADAPSPVGGVGVDVPAHAVRLGEPHLAHLGGDLLVECEVM